jgi:hypothetical protein
MASDHQAEYHARGSRVPSKHFRFERQLGQYELKYIHAETKENQENLDDDKHQAVINCALGNVLNKEKGFLHFPVEDSSDSRRETREVS